MIGGGISLFGFDLFGSVRKVLADAREEARLSSEAFAQKVKTESHDPKNVEGNDNVTLFWSSHLGY
ncbi:hypothetical protein [Aliirhizobium smilacinae]|uniref:Uncharacterized protein n=1 Tax=Aliirhizobium smilacinae TaxID=1395944 RepID=A0A5C4XGM6_9HYPH|nr:hypothetical protein [Rhizobium smilacinae]TNM61830.1 hypothetical protein FHP24_21490 [Rhizobium smilacinae]